MHFIKGQLISENNFGVFKSPKKRTKFSKDFCPSLWNESNPKNKWMHAHYQTNANYGYLMSSFIFLILPILETRAKILQKFFSEIDWPLGKTIVLPVLPITAPLWMTKERKYLKSTAWIFYIILTAPSPCFTRTSLTRISLIRGFKRGHSLISVPLNRWPKTKHKYVTNLSYKEKLTW